MRRFLLSLASVFVIATAGPAAAADTSGAPFAPTRASLSAHQVPQWWSDAKLGIFIHWGVYSVPAYATPKGTTVALPPTCTPYAEWYWLTQQIPVCNTWSHHLRRYGSRATYDDFIPRFRAERFDPDAWIRLFTEAGAGYFVLTSKHHDGFSLWCTETTDRDACAMGPRRDLVGELFAAARRAGNAVRPGLYYSLPEWFNPAPRPPSGLWGRSRWSNPVSLAFPNGLRARNAYTGRAVPYTGYRPIGDYARDHAVPQLRELIGRYRPSVLWCDLGGSEQYFRYNEVIADYYNAAAVRGDDVIVNDRCGDRNTHRDFATPEYSTERHTPPFEATRGLARSFGYNAFEPASDYLSTADLITTLIASVSQGGNLLINIGPRADGTIPEIMADRLRGLGRWLKINGSAVYGSTRWSVPDEGSNLAFSRGRDGAVYVFVRRWPGRSLTLRAPVPTGPGTRMTLLGGDGSPLRYTTTEGSVTIEMPADTQASSTTSPHTTVIRIAPGG